MNIFLALANAAALEDKGSAYVLWGIADKTHNIVGTNFDPVTTKKGNEPLENWLLRQLEPKAAFCFYTVDIDNRKVVILEIARATYRPVGFNGMEYIRIGEVKKPLKEAPEREREIWRVFAQKPFESLVAAEHLSRDQVLDLLDYQSYLGLLGEPLPKNRGVILDTLAADRLIQHCPAGDWDITNLGAILFAKQLADFPDLGRKAVRVIQYHGTDRLNTIKEQPMVGGYANVFKGLIRYIIGLFPSNEIIRQALRSTVPVYPELAIRELVANALIHQDFFVTGTSPMIEIFEGRIEITNPGAPLVSTARFVDTPPRSRNEALASLMRRSGICEERGSGIDKVIQQVELFQLPAPLFEDPGEFTRTTLFAYKDLKDMSKRDRVRACYLHACLCHVTKRKMTNATVRRRFGIADQNASGASRLLKEAVEDGGIVIEDQTAGTRKRSYLPFWANSPAKNNPSFV